MAAILAHTHSNMLRCDLLTLWCKDFDNKRRKSKNEPLDRQPPPTNQQPPDATSVFSFQLRFRNHLNTNVMCTTIRATQALVFISHCHPSFCYCVNFYGNIIWQKIGKFNTAEGRTEKRQGAKPCLGLKRYYHDNFNRTFRTITVVTVLLILLKSIKKYNLQRIRFTTFELTVREADFLDNRLPEAAFFLIFQRFVDGTEIG